MFSCYDFEKIKDEGIYNVADILNKENNYLFLDFYSVFHLLKNGVIEDKSLIIKQLIQKNHQYNLEVVDKNYDYLLKEINALRKRGIEILFLLSYLKNLENVEYEKINKYEQELINKNLYHFRSILTGKDLKYILNDFTMTILQFKINLEAINNLNTYTKFIKVQVQRDEEEEYLKVQPRRLPRILKKSLNSK